MFHFLQFITIVHEVLVSIQIWKQNFLWYAYFLSVPLKDVRGSETENLFFEVSRFAVSYVFYKTKISTNKLLGNIPPKGYYKFRFPPLAFGKPIGVKLSIGVIR